MNIKRSPLFNLVYEEKQDIDKRWNIPSVPYFKYVMELRKTSWAGMLIGAYKHMLKKRNKVLIEQLKIKIENDKKEGKTKGSWYQTLTRISGYLFLLSFLTSMFAPALMINFVKTKIENGEWVDASVATEETAGAEFIADPMANVTAQETVF